MLEPDEHTQFRTQLCKLFRETDIRVEQLKLSCFMWPLKYTAHGNNSAFQKRFFNLFALLVVENNITVSVLERDRNCIFVILNLKIKIMYPLLFCRYLQEMI